MNSEPALPNKLYPRLLSNDYWFHHAKDIKNEETVKHDAGDLHYGQDPHARVWVNKFDQRALGGIYARSFPGKNTPSDAPFPSLSRLDDEEIDERSWKHIKNAQRDQLLRSVRARLEAKYGGPGNPGRRPYEIVDHPYKPLSRRPSANILSRPQSPSLGGSTSGSDAYKKDNAAGNSRYQAMKEISRQYLAKSGGKQVKGSEVTKQAEETSPRNGGQGKHQGDTGKKSQHDSRDQEPHRRRHV